MALDGAFLRHIKTELEEKLLGARRERFYHDHIQRTVREARNLGLTDREVLDLLERGLQEHGD